ncbi:unnamed protein product [Nezara viridula]|uniref:Uncharacterized protein n=1 Tax=Nezara viridula TaxID=85310 RepID=A0A9P0H0Z1_NEZVI|nr:unnamed protein product [Nezara viridula]
MKFLRSSVEANASDLKDLKSSIKTQASIIFKNSEQLKAIELLLEAQNSKLDGLVLENSTLKSRVSVLEIKLNRSEQQHLVKTAEIR